MAKKIKFPLDMKDGVQVRTIEELKENFDIEKAMEHLLDGKLQTWLSDRYYIQEAEEVGQLDAYAADTKNKLYTILGIEKQQEEAGEVDVEAIERRKERLLKLKQFTDDEEIWDKVDLVAFDQEGLADLLDEECKTIYLCGEKFQVPYSLGNVSYIGINNPEVFINAIGDIDLDAQNITFTNVKILNENIETGEDLYQLGLSYLWERNGKEYDVKKAIECFKKASEKGHADAMARYVEEVNGDGCEEHNITENESKNLLETSITLGSPYGIRLKGAYIYNGSLGYEQDRDRGKEFLAKVSSLDLPYLVEDRYNITPSENMQEELEILNDGIRLQSAFAANMLGNKYYNGNKVISEDKKRAHELYELAMQFEEVGYPSDGWGYVNAGVTCIVGIGVEKSVEKGIACLKKACCERYANGAAGGAAGDAAARLAGLYWDGSKVEQNMKLAYKYAEMGRKWGNAEATFLAGRIQCEEAEFKNIKEGSEKLLEVANNDDYDEHDYAKAWVKAITGDEVIIAQIAQGGFYYVINERTDEPLSIERKTRVYFIDFEDIYSDRINKKRIMTWNADIMMVPKCKMLYRDNKVFLVMAALSEGILCVINTNTKEVEDRRNFEHNSFLGGLEIRIEKENGNTKVVYGTSGGQLNTYSLA